MSDPVHASNSSVGCDVGTARLITLSDGTYRMLVNAYEERHKDLAIAQRKLACMARGSCNYGKQKRLIRNIHIQIAVNCLDHLQKITHYISKNHALVAFEDLNIQNMTRSAKGTKDKPGKHIRHKSGLNRVILDQGWGTFKRLIEYKEAWRGGIAVFVNPAYIIQECAVCGHTSSENRQSRELLYC